MTKPVNESTIKSVKKSYTEELKKQPRECDQLQCMPQKRGRKVMLGADLDDKVQAYKMLSMSEMVVAR